MSFATNHHRSPVGLTALAFMTLWSSNLVACGGSGVAPAPPPPASIPTSMPLAIGVSFANAVFAVDVGQSEDLAAIVTHDPSGLGVTWTVTCPTGVASCGAMASAASGSGAADRFNAPANISAAEIISITATSVKDPSKSASVQLTVNPKPVPANPATASSTIGQSFSLDLSQYVQGGTAPFAWTAGTALPAGLTLNTATGVLSGTPSGVPATVVLAFTATDSGAPPIPVNLSLQLTINPQPASAASLTPGHMVLGCHWVAGSVRGYCTPPFVYSGTATLTNLGSAPLHISNMATTTSLFGYSSACPAALGTGQSCAIRIGWNGVFFGHGLFEVFDDAPHSPQVIYLYASPNL